MAGFRVKAEKQPEQPAIEPKMVSVLYFCRKEGWFMFKEISLPEDILEKHGTVKSETLPDILAIMLGQLTVKVRQLFDI